MFFVSLPGPDEPPANVTFITASLDTLTISWDPPPPDKQNGVIVMYSVRYWVVRDGEGMDSNGTRSQVAHNVRESASGELEDHHGLTIILPRNHNCRW